MCTYKYVYMYVCMYIFVCSELIEETTILSGVIFGMQGYFRSGSDKFESSSQFTTTM